MFRNFGLVIAAVIAGGLAVWRSVINQRQAHTAEQGQITDRYSEAVKMLSADNARTRTGAIYALARIAQDSVYRDHIPVMEVLTEFIRNPPYQEKADERAEARRAGLEAIEIGAAKPADLELPPPVQCPDIHAALKVIANRNDAQRVREKAARFVSNLDYAALQELDLRWVTLTGASLIGANLTGADLTGARLIRADLIGANLTGADLTYAKLTHAQLFSAELIKTTDLTQAQITSCSPGAPPINLPDGLTWPFVMKDGEWVREE